MPAPPAVGTMAITTPLGSTMLPSAFVETWMGIIPIMLPPKPPPPRPRPLFFLPLPFLPHFFLEPAAPYATPAADVIDSAEAKGFPDHTNPCGFLLLSASIMCGLF